MVAVRHLHKVILRPLGPAIANSFLCAQCYIPSSLTWIRNTPKLPACCEQCWTTLTGPSVMWKPSGIFLSTPNAQHVLGRPSVLHECLLLSTKRDGSCLGGNNVWIFAQGFSHSYLLMPGNGRLHVLSETSKDSCRSMRAFVFVTLTV